MTAPDDLVALHLKRSLATLTAAVDDGGFRATVTAIAARIAAAFRAGHKVLAAMRNPAGGIWFHPREA